MMRMVKGCLMTLGYIGIAGMAIIIAVGVYMGQRGPATTSGQPSAQSSPAASAPASVAKVGQRVESAGIALTVNGVRWNPIVAVGGSPNSNTTMLVANVTLENSARETAPYNPLYFKAKDANGYEYTASAAAYGASAASYLKSGELAHGDHVRGEVAFHVPVDAKGFVLSYQPLVIFGGYRVLRVGLD